MPRLGAKRWQRWLGLSRPPSANKCNLNRSFKRGWRPRAGSRGGEGGRDDGEGEDGREGGPVKIERVREGVSPHSENDRCCK